jgi:hypothetical protein
LIDFSSFFFESHPSNQSQSLHFPLIPRHASATDEYVDVIAGVDLMREPPELIARLEPDGIDSSEKWKELILRRVSMTCFPRFIIISRVQQIELISGYQWIR